VQFVGIPGGNGVSRNEGRGMERAKDGYTPDDRDHKSALADPQLPGVPMSDTEQRRIVFLASIRL